MGPACAQATATLAGRSGPVIGWVVATSGVSRLSGAVCACSVSPLGHRADVRRSIRPLGLSASDNGWAVRQRAMAGAGASELGPVLSPGRSSHPSLPDLNCPDPPCPAPGTTSSSRTASAPGWRRSAPTPRPVVCASMTNSSHTARTSADGDRTRYGCRVATPHRIPLATAERRHVPHLLSQIPPRLAPGRGWSQPHGHVIPRRFWRLGQPPVRRSDGVLGADDSHHSGWSAPCQLTSAARKALGSYPIARRADGSDRPESSAMGGSRPTDHHTAAHSRARGMVSQPG